MNDLMPPPRRRMPDQHRHALRRVLQQPEPSATPLSRSATPWLAAAAVAVIAAGGYGLANVIGDSGGNADGMAPAGGTESTAPRDPSPSPERSTPPQGTPTVTAGSVPPVPFVAPDEAYYRCITQVRQTPQKPPFDDPRGRVVASSAGVTTVVVSNGTWAWACNVLPDTALSHAVPDSPPRDVDAETFAFALNAARNFRAGPGELAWAGGVLPEGVTSLTYVFPDGHAEPAVTRDGYWVMQYLSPKPWGDDLNQTDPVAVQLSGPGGDRTVTVPLGFDTVCNQVTHGC